MVIPSEVRKLIKDLTINAPANQETIDNFEKISGVKLPDDYVNFLKQTDGAEGFVGNNYVILWSLEEVLQLNADYKADEYKPGLLLIGSNGGGEAFAFDRHSMPMSVIQIPFISINRDGMTRLGSTFNDFLKALQSA